MLLDGFDLGVGILFPFSPSDKSRNIMINSIAPFWDGNETWLILGGGGLFVAFPLAYSILLPAFYIPLITMLLGLIMRGIAFEFRAEASEKSKKFWDYIFHFGSLIAAFCQGMILGSFVTGIEAEGRNYSGGPFNFATGFSVMTGIATVFGYALLGSTWLIMKTEDETAKWSRSAASYVLFFVGVFMVLVSISMPFVDIRITNFWFSMPNFFYLLPIPLITVILFVYLWIILNKTNHETAPFLLSIAIFFMGYLGLGISIYPWIIPFKYNIWEAASSGPSLSLILVGVVPLLPIILGYTAYSYYIFRGKVNENH